MSFNPPLPPAVQAAAEQLLRQHSSEYNASYLTAADFSAAACDLVVAIQPVIQAETYEALADRTEKSGPLTPAGMRAVAMLIRSKTKGSNR